MTKIAVLGGGNGAHAAAADLTLRGFEVNMYEDERFAPNIQQVFDTKKIELSGAAGTGTAELAMVTSDLAAAIEGVKVILVAVPAFAHAAYAEKLAEVVSAGQIVVVLPGTFGSLMFGRRSRPTASRTSVWQRPTPCPTPLACSALARRSS